MVKKSNNTFEYNYFDIIKNNMNELTTNINSNKIAYGQTSGSARSPKSINKY
jgi:hypothetical protein